MNVLAARSRSLVFVTLVLTALTTTRAHATVTGVTVAPHTFAENSVFSGTVATFSSSAPTAASLTASIGWGDGTTNSGVAVTGSAGSYSVSGTHTYADEGTFNVQVSIADSSDSSNGNGSGTYTITEGDVLTPHAVAINVTEGATFNGTVATFTDTDTNNVPSDFTVSVDWGAA